MKRRSVILIVMIIIFFCGCKRPEEGEGNVPPKTESEVEISLSMPGGGSTRAVESDAGTYSENNIQELDLLVFKDDKYQYRRPAYRTQQLTNNFRATLLVDEDILTIYLLVNCREHIEDWDPSPQSATHVNKSWETVAKALVDRNPANIITTDAHKPLPMWGVVRKPVSDKGLNEWKKVNVMRSVASADIYVKKGDGTKTSGFNLTDAYIYFAADRGYLGIRNEVYVEGDPFGITGPDSPVGMKTTLTLHSASVGIGSKADSIAHKLFMYDNTVSQSTADKANDLRFSRIVVGGYYTPEGKPQNTTVKSYYPVDFIAADGNYRRITRNWKYVFNVTAVVGPGYSDPDVAAESFPADINVEVIFWNREFMEGGQDGPNYISMTRKYSILTRAAGSEDLITIMCNMPASELSLKFDGQADPFAPYADTIENGDFIITKVEGSDGTLVGLNIRAKHNYDPARCTGKIVLKHRVLKYEIDIVQKDADPTDWEFGGGGSGVLE